MEKAISICKRAAQAATACLVVVGASAFAGSEAAWFVARHAYRETPPPTRAAVVFFASSQIEDERRRAAAHRLAQSGAVERVVFVGGARQSRGENGAARQAALFADESGGSPPASFGHWSYDTVTNVEEAIDVAGRDWIAVSDCLHVARIMVLAEGAALQGFCSAPGGPLWRFKRSWHEALAWGSLALPQSWRDSMLRRSRLGGGAIDR